MYVSSLVGCVTLTGTLQRQDSLGDQVNEWRVLEDNFRWVRASLDLIGDDRACVQDSMVFYEAANCESGFCFLDLQYKGRELISCVLAYCPNRPVACGLGEVTPPRRTTNAKASEISHRQTHLHSHTHTNRALFVSFPPTSPLLCLLSTPAEGASPFAHG